jgi:hypothetical protein
VCGCPGVEPACTLCFGSTTVPDPSSPALGENGSCGMLLDVVLRLTADECTESQNALIANAIECGCQHDVSRKMRLSMSGKRRVLPIELGLLTALTSLDLRENHLTDHSIRAGSLVIIARRSILQIVP